MNLILDIGNTFCKICVFNGNDLICKEIVKTDSRDIISGLDKVSEKYSLASAIMSSVSFRLPEVESYVKSLADKFLVMDHDTIVPIRNSYSTPKTLGIDRLAAVVGASVMFPGKTALVIDAGTAITYDVLKDGIEFLGGNIAPGISLRFRSLNEHTSKLPLISEYSWKDGFGKDTVSAINNGVLNGLAYEIDGYIKDFDEKYPDSVKILTGGDSIFLSKTIKNTIFAEPNLVAIGLNRILNYNVSKNF